MPSSTIIIRFSCICQDFTQSLHPTLRECGVNECGVRSGVWSGPKERKEKENTCEHGKQQEMLFCRAED